MNKKIIAIAIIGMFLLTGLTTVSAVEMKASGTKSTGFELDIEQNEILTDEPKYEYSWLYGQIDVMDLKNAEFTYHPLSQVTTEGIWGGTGYEGLMFGVTIAGVFDEEETNFYYCPIFLGLFRILHEDDLGLEDGNYIEITFKFARVRSGGDCWVGSSGAMYFDNHAIGTTLKIYEEIPT